MASSDVLVVMEKSLTVQTEDRVSIANGQDSRRANMSLTSSAYWREWYRKHAALVNKRKRRRYLENQEAERRRARVYYDAHKNEVNEKDCEQRFRYRGRRILDDSLLEQGLSIVSKDWLGGGTFIVESPGHGRIVESLRDPLPVW